MAATSGLPPSQSLRILTIDGGGIKGYTALLILKRIFRTLKDNGDLSEEPRPCDVFDLIAGTSTGGLIAVMLGRLKMTIDECIAQYESVSVKVFKGRPSTTKKLLQGLISSPFYDIVTLQTEVKTILSSRNIGPSENFLESQSPRCKVMLCVTRTSTSKADLLRNYRTSNPTEENYDCYIWEAASATAAAPMYFKPVQFEKSGKKWNDGGMRRNNPIREALAEIGREKSWEGRQIGCVLSLGTGVAKIKGVSTNLAGFLRGSVDIMTDSEDIADEFSASQLGRELAASHRYFRFNVPQGIQDLEMDECKETEKMDALTTEYLRKTDTGLEVERCAKSLLNPDENLQTAVTHKPSSLPYSPCTHFVDRLSYAKILQSFFRPQMDGPQIFVLWGLGGAGKTQIALKFAQSMTYKLSVFWIRADNFTNFIHDYVRLLKVLEPSTSEDPLPLDQTALLGRITRNLDDRPSEWLLILDNADDIEQFRPPTAGEAKISMYIPRKGRILITTRDPRFQGDISEANNGTKVTTMNDAEAGDLLLRSVPSRLIQSSKETVTLAHELLQDLGNLPLAIAQAAANIRELQLSLSQYVAAYRDKRQRMRLMERAAEDFHTTDPHTSSQSVAITWELSFEHLESHHPLSAKLLCHMGFYHWRDIPSSLIVQHPEFCDLEPYVFREVVKRLLHFSLVEESGQGESFIEYHLHPIVHERIVNRLSDDERMHYLLPNVAVLATMFPLSTGDDDLDGSLCRYLLPHAIHQIDLGEDLKMAQRPLARLLQVVSNFLARSGLTALAVDLATRSLEIATEVWDSNDVSILWIRKVKVICLNLNAQYAASKEELKQCFQELESEELIAVLSKQQAGNERVGLLIQLGESCRALGEHEEEERIQREILDFDNSAPEYELSRYRIRHNIANAAKNQGRLDEAKTMNDELLAIAESSEDSRAFDKRFYLAMLNLKAHILRRRVGERRSNDIEDALSIYLRVYNVSLDDFGISDIDTVKAGNNCIGTLLEEKRYVEAAQFLANYLPQFSSVKHYLGGQYFESFEITFNHAFLVIGELMGSRLSQAPSFDRVEALLLDAITYVGMDLHLLMEKPGHLNVYGVRCQKQGKFKEAEDVHRLALELIEENTPDPGGLLDIIYYNIMLAIARQPGRLSEAYDFRNTYLEHISRAEALHKDLDTRLKGFKEDEAIYHEAESMLKSGLLHVNDEWWKEHDAALLRTERLFGPLELISDPEATSPEATIAEATNANSVSVSTYHQRRRQKFFRSIGALIRKQPKIVHEAVEDRSDVQALSATT